MIRILLVSLLGAAILCTNAALGSAGFDTRGLDVRPDSKITVVYVSAWNCPPCFAWSKRHMAAIEASFEWGHIRWREVAAYSYKDTGYDSRWPQDLKWVRDELEIRRGAPRWAIVLDDRAVWYSAWAKRSRWEVTWQAVQTLVSAKMGGKSPTPPG